MTQRSNASVSIVSEEATIENTMTYKRRNADTTTTGAVAKNRADQAKTHWEFQQYGHKPPDS